MKCAWPGILLIRILAGILVLSALSEAAQDTGPKPGRIITEYALTSGGSWEHPDPGNWRLQASNDAGESWETLDVQTNQVFTGRSQRRVFTISNHTAFNLYRLSVEKAQTVQLAELELIGPAVGVANEKELKSSVTASRDQPLIGPATDAFDHDPNTRWVDYGRSGTCWIQCQYVLQSELVVSNVSQVLLIARRNATRNPLPDQAPQILSRITAQAGKPVRVLNGYALTSANDAPERDPRDWRLLGSNDEGKSWDTLDVRRNESFTTRFQRRVFALAAPASYALYRLQIDCVRVPDGLPGGASCLQLAALDPLYASKDPGGKFSIVVSAQGENQPMEISDALFDGDTRTKWLDFGAAAESAKTGINTNRSSWVQWQYLSGTDVPIVNLNWLRSARARSTDPIHLRLEGVAIGWQPESHLLAFVDQSGFQSFELPGLAGEISIGERIRLKGQLLLGLKLPEIINLEMVSLGAIPAAAEFPAEQFFAGHERFSFGEMEGKVISISDDPPFSAIQLRPTHGPGYLIARVFNPARESLAIFPGCRVKLKGVIESAFDQTGKRIPGIIWLAHSGHVTLLPPLEDEWSSWRYYSIESLTQPRPPVRLGQPARVMGTLSDQSHGNFVLTENQTNKIIVIAKESPTLPAESVAEAVGLFTLDGGIPVLRAGSIRSATSSPLGTEEIAGTEKELSRPVRQIKKVFDLAKKYAGKSFPVKLRGVITYIDLGLSTFYLQEGSDAIEVSGVLSAGLSPFLRQEGLYVEVQGQFAPNDQNIIPSSFVRVLGPGQLPEPKRHSWDFLVTGKYFNRWVEIEGVVREAGEHRLLVVMNGGKLVVWINDMDRNSREGLLGSTVRICGVCSPVINRGNTAVGIRLLVPSMTHVQVLKAFPEDPFSIPLLPMAEVMGFGSAGDDSSMRLVKTEGIVTHQGPQQIFIQKNGDGLRVIPRNELRLEPGDRVEVVGFAEPDGFSPKLVQAVVRKTGSGPLPAANSVDSLETDLSNQDATRGTIDAVVLGTRLQDALQILDLQEEKRLQAFSAFFPTNHGLLRPYATGTRVRIAGVFKSETDSLPDYGQVISSFGMYGNGPDDILVLEQPSWWSAGHTLWVLAGVGGLLLATLGWVRSLRNQVRERTGNLREEIAERKLAEVALRDSEALYHSLVDHLPICVFRKDKQGRYVFVNSTFCELLGQRAEHLLGKNTSEIAGERLGKKITTDDQRVMETREPLELEEAYFDVSGTLRDFHVMRSPVFSSDGAIVGTQGMLFDITQRKRAEQALRDSQALYHSLVESLPQNILRKDLDGRFTFANGVFCRYMNRSVDRILGKRDCDLFPDSLAEKFRQDDRRVLACGQLFQTIEQNRSSDGEERFVEVIKTPLFNAERQPVGLQVIFWDVTERKRAEVRLEQVHRQLLETSRRAGMAEVATSVLHNVGNVLNSVNISASLLMEKIKKSKAAPLSQAVALVRQHEHDLGAYLSSDPKGKQLPGYLGRLAEHLASEQSAALGELKQLVSNIDHIKDIVSMQQSYSKVAGVAESVQAAELVEDALRMNAGALTRHEVKLIREYDAGLPAVTVEKHKVLQVLVNLVRNAKYACDESGRMDKQMTVRVRNGDGRIKISIADNGVGIPAENLTRIFNMGFTTRKTGHGYGLHSSALAARELGGALRVHSDGPDRGAIFTLELPVETQTI